jgi:hypothetical protein
MAVADHVSVGESAFDKRTVARPGNLELALHRREHNALVLIYLTGSHDSNSNDVNERALNLAFWN